HWKAANASSGTDGKEKTLLPESPLKAGWPRERPRAHAQSKFASSRQLWEQPSRVPQFFELLLHPVRPKPGYCHRACDGNGGNIGRQTENPKPGQTVCAH